LTIEHLVLQLYVIDVIKKLLESGYFVALGDNYPHWKRTSNFSRCVQLSLTAVASL